MHRNTFIALLICCIALISIVSAQCGPAVGLSCSSGNCCSKDGFCGTGPDYCGTGCQPQFGSCGDASITSATVSSTPSPSGTVSPSASTSATTISETTMTTAVPSVTTTTTTTTTTDSTTSTTSTGTKGTFQLQPTSNPSGASTSQDKSKLALVVVFLAGLFMI